MLSPSESGASLWGHMSFMAIHSPLLLFQTAKNSPSSSILLGRSSSRLYVYCTGHQCLNQLNTASVFSCSTGASTSVVVRRKMLLFEWYRPRGLFIFNTRTVLRLPRSVSLNHFVDGDTRAVLSETDLLAVHAFIQPLRPRSANAISRIRCNLSYLGGQYGLTQKRAYKNKWNL